MNIQSLPKIELHLHLDCSLSYAVVRRIDPEVTEEEYRSDFIAPAKCTNLADFLTRAPRGFGLMQSEEQLRLVTEDVFEQLQADNVIYAEIRFAPLLHVEKGLSSHRVVEVVNEAALQASQATEIEARLILCTLRHYTTEQSMETVKLVEDFQGTLVAALDIAGDEAGHPIAPHIPAFRYAQEHGLNRTAHAGEAAGPESVWETLEHLRPSRIGHGVRSAEDPELVDYLIRQRILLEVCPSSNVQTNICETYADHPVDRLYRQGVPLSISTDTRTITDITLDGEYEKLHRTFEWGTEELLRTNLEGVRAAFIPEDVKQRLAEQLRVGYEVAA